MDSILDRRPNWLLRSLVIGSIAVHAVIFMYVSGLYKSKEMTVIELSLFDEGKPPQRSIPRPRLRPKDMPKPVDVNRIIVKKRAIPALKPLSIEPVDRDLPDTISEAINIQDSPTVPGYDIASFDSTKWADVGASDYDSPKHYLEMIKFKIERKKRYPKKAESRHIEGQTVVSFVIGPQGEIHTLLVKKSSKYDILDQAALSAVKNAAPFPKPPVKHFKGKDIRVAIVISFELR